MVYLLDANVLITANDHYYPFDMVPQFWSWLEHMAGQGSVQMPIEIYEEVAAGREDDLTRWIKSREVKAAICMAEDVDGLFLQATLDGGYAPDLNDAEIEKMGQDPFLVAYAMSNPEARTVVSNEVSKPSKRRGNRKLPDVCSAMGVNCISPFAMLRALGFHTNWQQPTAARMPQAAERRPLA